MLTLLDDNIPDILENSPKLSGAITINSDTFEFK